MYRTIQKIVVLMNQLRLPVEHISSMTFTHSIAYFIIYHHGNILPSKHVPTRVNLYLMTTKIMAESATLDLSLALYKITQNDSDGLTPPHLPSLSNLWGFLYFSRSPLLVIRHHLHLFRSLGIVPRLPWICANATRLMNFTDKRSPKSFDGFGGEIKCICISKCEEE